MGVPIGDGGHKKFNWVSELSTIHGGFLIGKAASWLLFAAQPLSGTGKAESECGWAVVYEEPVDPLSDHYNWLEDRQRNLEES